MKGLRQDFKHSAILFFFFLSQISFSFKQTESIEPLQAIRRQCEEILKTELGEKKFSTQVKILKEKSETRNFEGGKTRTDFFLTFGLYFPESVGDSVILGFTKAVYAGGSRLASERFLRENKSDLPPGQALKMGEIIPRFKAMELAFTENPELNKTKTTAELVLTQTHLTWVMLFTEPVTNQGEREVYLTHSIVLDALTGNLLYSGTEKR